MEGSQLIREFEVTTPSGKKHIVREPVSSAVVPEPQETVEEKLNRMEETQDLLLMMMLEQEGIL